MRQSLRRSAFAVLGLLLVAWAVLPMAVATAASAQNVTNGDEGWFLKNKEPLAGSPVGDPSCELPTGCNVSGNVTRPSGPHPEGVLVVAANGGDDDAQTFFNFNVDKLPLGALVTGGSVTMPVAQDSDARNFRPEAAKLVACLVTGFIPGGTDGGSYEARPEFDDKTCVDVKQDDKAETLTYTFDLERFGKLWGTGTTPMNGVTILKDPKVTAPNPDETWRVVFNQTRRGKDDPKAFPPITSNLQFKVEKLPTFEVPPAAGGGGATVPSGGGGGFPAADPGAGSGSTDFGSGSTDSSFGSGSAPTDTGSIDSPAAPDTPPADTAPPAAAGGETPLTTAPPAAVPAAANPSNLGLWLLPFLALAMAGALWWSLSRPVELAGDREGAVSRLMRNRRLAAEASTPSTP